MKWKSYFHGFSLKIFIVNTKDLPQKFNGYRYSFRVLNGPPEDPRGTLDRSLDDPGTTKQWIFIRGSPPFV